MIRRLLVLLVVSTPSVASAGKCDAYVARAASARGDDLVRAYENLASCDRAVAKAEFARFMVGADDLETLVPLTLTAIRYDAWNAVWEMMERVPYEHRTALAAEVGAACDDVPQVVAFLEGAHAGLKGADFTSWSPALPACRRDDLATWMADIVAAPPASPYNEKYNAVLTAFLDARGSAALGPLEAAAIKAGTAGGPFVNLLDAMQRAVTPKDVRSHVSGEDEAALNAALGRIAKAVPPVAARQVADKLYSTGATTQAAALLPSIYPDRVVAGGEMAWAAAAVESCDGEAVVHWVTWSEPPTRLDVLTPATEPLRAVKHALKCEAAAPWPVRATTEPVASQEAAEAWVDALVAEQAGVKAKAREEKKVVVP